MSDTTYEPLPPDWKERRRYALLQAAAVLTAGQDFTKPLNAAPEAKWYEFAVAQAEKLLSEIESREQS